MEKTIFTLGHTNRSFLEFIQITSLFGIRRIVDVRAVPFSQYTPQFDRSLLRRELKNYSLEYIYMGGTLGERPSNEELYMESGTLDYEKVSQTPEYQAGIASLLPLCDGRTLIFSSHIDPINSHRGLLIGRTLDKCGVVVNHIVGRDMPTIITQEELSEKLVDLYFPDRWQLSLPFMDEPICMEDMISAAYYRQNEKTAWKINQDIVLINKRKKKETKDEKREKTFVLLEKSITEEYEYFPFME